MSKRQTPNVFSICNIRAAQTAFNASFGTFKRFCVVQSRVVTIPGEGRSNWAERHHQTIKNAEPLTDQRLRVSIHRLLFFIFCRVRLDFDHRAAFAQTRQLLGLGGMGAHLFIDRVGDVRMQIQEFFGILTTLA
jgi:hypothetical protein